MTFQDDVAAEVRAELARRMTSGREIGRALGWTQYYVAARLRGDVEFSLSDLKSLADYLEMPVTNFFRLPTSSGFSSTGGPAWP